MAKKIVRTIWVFITIWCVLIFLFSLWQIHLYYSDYNAAKESYDDAQELVQIDRMLAQAQVDQTEIKPNEPIEQTKSVETEEIEEKHESMEEISQYTHLHLNFEIDWERLRNESDGLVGWIYLPDTNINYPLVQSDSNDYYLNRDYTGKWTSNGSIFLDRRVALSSQNVLIYGHNMKADIMFHRLRNYPNQEYTEAHPYIYIVTEDDVRIYQVFSVVYADKNSDTYTFDFGQNMSFQEYVDKAMKESVVELDASFIKDDAQLVTLSTCSGRSKTERLAVHAALVNTYKQ